MYMCLGYGLLGCSITQSKRMILPEPPTIQDIHVIECPRSGLDVCCCVWDGESHDVGGGRVGYACTGGPEKAVE